MLGKTNGASPVCKTGLASSTLAPNSMENWLSGLKCYPAKVVDNKMFRPSESDIFRSFKDIWRNGSAPHR